MVQFRDFTKEFEFHRVQFPHEVGENGDVNFSETNPATCITCHTKKPRPNWERYDEWPGAYGKKDDFPKGEELLALEAFLKKGMPFGRYRFLTRLEGSSSAPYEIKERGRLRFRPNFRLNALTFAYQAEHLLALLRQHPKFSEVSFSVLP